MVHNSGSSRDSQATTQHIEGRGGSSRACFNGAKIHFHLQDMEKRSEGLGEYVEVIPNRMMKSRQLPQGMFKGFEDTMQLEASDHLTRVTAILNY